MEKVRKNMKNLIIWSVYSIHLIYFYVFVVWTVGLRVQEKCLGNWRCSHYLQTSSYGYWIDTADHQWREFRNSLGLLIVVAVGTSFLDRLCYRFKIDVITVRLIVGIVVILVQHRFYAILTLSLAYLGFLIPQYIRWPRVGIVLSWIWILFVLLLKESYRLQHIKSWSWISILFLGRYSGMYSWRLPANFLALRILSYNLDYYNDLQKYVEDIHISQKHQNNASDTKNIPFDQQNSADISSRLAEKYNLISYFSYITYAPLYMAGPIITFKEYHNYSRSPQQAENILLYGFRFVYCYALMEFLLSKFPCFAIISSNLLPHLSLVEMLVVFYLLLKMMWLKFLLLWRFFRLWALMDGVNPPENMLKCMSNNYSLGKFWKNWHASFNQWIVKYLYLPLGGRSTQIWNVWFIFLFVALWHDFEWKLFCWGLMNAVFYLLEIIFVQYLRPKWLSTRNQPPQRDSKRNNSDTILVRCVDAIFGAVYIMILMLINLIGYSMGTGAIPLILEKLLTTNGLMVLLGSLYFLFIGVNIMFSIEEWRAQN